MTRRVLLSASHAPGGCRLEPRLLPFVTLAGRDQIGCSIVASASETASFQPWLEQNTSESTQISTAPVSSCPHSISRYHTIEETMRHRPNDVGSEWHAFRKDHLKRSHETCRC